MNRCSAIVWNFLSNIGLQDGKLLGIYMGGPLVPLRRSIVW